ncbi:hypothetical protein BLOT_007776 [Blomia tropicalis]|nr:hypothetical protein BLOT_007776 [Blomia tropicalis]
MQFTCSILDDNHHAPILTYSIFTELIDAPIEMFGKLMENRANRYIHSMEYMANLTLTREA